MDEGEPVCVTFTYHSDISGNLDSKISADSELLFCEMVQKARYGGVFNVEKDGCPVGNYVLGKTNEPPFEYYLKSGRYKNRTAAYRASKSIPKISKPYKSVWIEPLSINKGQFNVLILFLKPESAMRIIQAYSYLEGKQIKINTLGAASVCGECIAKPISCGIGASFGCKGSRKHSKYKNTEVPIGISFEMIDKIEEGLENTPDTWV
ncbi:DUF169 domain-containing protein [Methanohalobium sp.]|uniref:DUF169 domain-containing protein n=1 Tax=Methanohalobium sp. TaxID=2837493 RepID=UPI00397DCC27